ncbi:MAG: 50S ribosomal protein L25 [Candidatus Margulisiibacteriota bacterium]
MEFEKLSASVRKELGKNKIKALRAQGLIPAIIYGQNSEPQPVSVDPRELQKLFRSGQGKNSIISLSISGGAAASEQLVISYRTDMDAIRQELTHVDFLRVDLKTPIKTVVKLELTGVCPGVKMGGNLVQKMRQATIKCLPQEIPSVIQVDLSSLGLGETIRIKDLSEGKSYSFLAQDHDIVVGVEGQKVEEASTEDAK